MVETRVRLEEQPGRGLSRGGSHGGGGRPARSGSGGSGEIGRATNRRHEGVRGGGEHENRRSPVGTGEGRRQGYESQLAGAGESVMGGGERGQPTGLCSIQQGGRSCTQ